MTILLFYTLWNENMMIIEKWEGWSQNTCKKSIIANKKWLSTDWENVSIIEHDAQIQYSMVVRQVFLDPPHHFSPNSKNDDFTVLYAYEMKIWW